MNALPRRRQGSLASVNQISSSSSHSSEGSANLLNDGGSALQVPQATVELADDRSVVWPDSLSEWFLDGAGPVV